jgi:uncharacterized protein (TIGR02246 family)
MALTERTKLMQRGLIKQVLHGVTLLLTVLALLTSQAIAQPSDTDQAAIREALTKWTADFNAGNTQEVCNLFSPDLLYDYQGQPERSYRDICDLLHRSLTDRTKRYRYSFAIREILAAGDLAVVRLTWTLTITRPDIPGETVSREHGMDIFRKQPDGPWKIIRYIAYDDR